MNNIERRDKELAYISDGAVLEEQAKCRKIYRIVSWIEVILQEL